MLLIRPSVYIEATSLRARLAAVTRYTMKALFVHEAQIVVKSLKSLSVVVL